MPYWTFFRRDGASPTAKGEWESLRHDSAETSQLIDELLGSCTLELDDLAPVEIRRTPLPFYPGFTLLELIGTEKEVPQYFIHKPGHCHHLDGTLECIFALNRKLRLILDRKNVAEYLRFFLAHTFDEKGRHFLVEKLEDFRWRYAPSEHDFDWLKSMIQPIDVDAYENTGYFVVATNVLRMDSLLRCSFSVRINGDVVRIGQSALANRLPVVKDALGDTPRPRTHFNLESGWKPVDDDESAELLRLIGHALATPSDDRSYSRPHLRQSGDDKIFFGAPDRLVCKEVPFFPEARLMRADYQDPQRDLGYGLYALVGSEHVYLLSYSSSEIHKAREREILELNPDTALDYLRFFCLFIHAKYGAFRVVEMPSDMNVVRGPKAETMPRNITEVVSFDSLSLADLNLVIQPPYLEKSNDRDSVWRCRVCMQYGAEVSNTVLELDRTGRVYMTEDMTFISGLPVDVSRETRPFLKTDVPKPAILLRTGTDDG